MREDIKFKYNQFLDQLAESVDISPSNYQKAVDRYTAVGNWLGECEYGGCYDKPTIYPQGSFRLGTVIRPIREGKDADYDIDLVCELQKDKLKSFPRIVKHEIGNRLSDHANYRDMLGPEGRRCWTLNYAEADGIGFHLDVLPSTPEEYMIKSGLIRAGVMPSLAEKAIAITQRDGKSIYTWSASNPNGYAELFAQINWPAFKRVANIQKRKLFADHRSVFANVESVPDQLVRTPLQRAIQILKHHRDKKFSGRNNEQDKPISIIITTLAAQFYDNEEDVFSALQNISSQIYEHARLLDPGYGLKEKLATRRIISKTQDGRWCIPNPVNPNENFADRWHEEDHRRAKAFFQWVAWVRTDLVEIVKGSDGQRVTDSVKEIFGEKAARTAAGLITGVSAPNIYVPKEVPMIQINPSSKPWGFR